MDLVLDREAFILALTRSPHLSSDSLPSMVYVFLRDCFVLNDYVNGFDIFFEMCEHIIHGHVLPLVSRLFDAS
jgi:hypothetical protein